MTWIVPLLLSAPLPPDTLPAPPRMEIQCSDPALESAFYWAQSKALSFVQTGKQGPINVWKQGQEAVIKTYIPSYWAGYPLRTAFYSRDFCHQAVGAHLLVLKEENFSMLRAFAQSANPSTKWYPLWAINFDGLPYTLDYHHDGDFVREVPAVFELVEKIAQLYRWTGDPRYLADSSLWRFATKALTEFIDLHDQQFPNGVAEGTGTGDIFAGVATYNEQPDAPLIEAGDGLACQYQAFLAFSDLAAWRKERSLARQFAQKAEMLKAYFHSDWGIRNTDWYNRGYIAGPKPISGWGKENSWFLLTKGLADPTSLRTHRYLEFISERLDSREDIPDNIEALTYIPETFFRYHRNELGWKWMKHIIHQIDQTHAQSSLTGANGNYPEVSFALISNVVEHLIGLTPEAGKRRLRTLSHLPDDLESLEVRHIPIGNGLFSVAHSGRTSSKLTYQKGSAPFLWQAAFPGNYKQVTINGKKKRCRYTQDFGQVISYTPIRIKPKKTVIVEVLPLR
ncbi:MAG: hypothetical protein IPH16_10610 [Haliscomenobacter sp.]|nr:hypothetical protein [Haliscomenobacter sp.]